jgi:hypothetical protein
MSALIDFALLIGVPLLLTAIACRYFSGSWPWERDT